MGLIRKIYTEYGDDVHEHYFNEQKDTLCSGGDDQPKISAKETLFGKEYRVGTWVCIFVAVANTFAGVNLVNQYAFTIYNMLNEGILDAALSPSLNTYIVGITGFVGACGALVTVRTLTRRVLFIAGHTMIALSIGLCIYFSSQKMPVPFLIFHCLMIVSF